MKYYPHHIGDFDRATRHLTRIERSVYRDLIEMYYDTECELPLDVPGICRKIIARTNEEVTAVEQTLNEFFTKTERGYYHDRCEEELDAYRTSSSQKSAAGKASAAKRAEKKQRAVNARSTDVTTVVATDVSTNVERTCNGSATIQEPGTRNQEPGKTNPPRVPRFDAQAHLESWGVESKVASDWLKLRKVKHLAPTETAFDGMRAEAEKAQISVNEALKTCCKRGWGGFEASWLLPKAGPHGPPKGATPGRHSGFSEIDYREGVTEDGLF